MISLLPPDAKKELAAARANVLLVRYLILTVAVIAFLGVELVVAHIFFTQQRSISENAIAENEKQTAALSSVKADATAFNSDLKVASSILSKQISYTSIIKEFADTMPSGTIIKQLAIDPAAIGKPTTLTISAKDEKAVLKFKDTFAASPYFDKVSIQNISNPASDPQTTTGYPFTATINLTFKPSLLTVGVN